MSCQDCNDIAAFVAEFVDGMFDDMAYGPSQAQLISHVERCSACRELADAELLFRDLVARKCQESAPIELRMQVQRMIQIQSIQITIE